ncbi:MAG: hypothetical protein R6V85_03040 [Polyangia bacterium]
MEVDTQESGCLYLARYSEDGALSWVRFVDQIMWSSNDLDTLPSGEAMWAGRVLGGVGGNGPPRPVFGAGGPNEHAPALTCYQCPFLARYTAGGDFDWVAAATGPGGPGPDEWSQGGYGRGVAVFDDESSCLVGDLEEPLVFGAEEEHETGMGCLDDADPQTSNYDGFVARYEADGSLLWARWLGGFGMDSVHDAVAIEDGTCVVIGTYSGTAWFHGGGEQLEQLAAAGARSDFVAWYGPDGSLTRLLDLGFQDTIAYSNGSGQIERCGDGYAVAGSYSGGWLPPGGGAHQAPEGGRAVFVASLDEDGNAIWSSSAGTPVAFRGAGPIETMPNGGVLVGGSFGGTLTFAKGDQNETVLESFHEDSYPGFLALYRKDGSFDWAFSIGGGQGSWSNGVNGISAPSEETIYIVGVFTGTAAFGTGHHDVFHLTSWGDHDIFVARLDRVGIPD